MKKSVQNSFIAARFVDLATTQKRLLAILCTSLIAACSTAAPAPSPPLESKAPEPCAPASGAPAAAAAPAVPIIGRPSG
jgi:hypothetical protein